MKLYYTICYISKAHPDLSEDQIKDLFAHTSKSNLKCDVSGILMHSLGNFFQVLEGNKKHLLQLYDKIKEDSRHGDLYEVYNKDTAHPVFLNYNSKFDIVKSPADLNNIMEYLNLNTMNSTNLKLRRLLKPFTMLEEF